ncbi:TauD/TfdA dioxygenase family protein [Gordonia hankookensis]|uniref:TauD/TfdA family dioxygenase n=1 Tax=Gordonia hankookensis TaxID=589403 RepID=A0ABR7W9F1_9ACTN|nr:TauD/TfdA family dioxygenase [Gordonia hankookensis]MBD1319432.1 TauD/TfdA family dioxygenase [Gordonia hankookensis]NDZ96147.1 TauD/TfdA family dioxygenase [Streptomyces sp. SID11726]NEB23640.1 TauD/TfdA family dioxygenase [Streptomyces sp. SID6673]
MIETSALTPAMGVKVSGIDDLRDPAVIGRCLEALKWRGVLLIRGLHLDDPAQVEFSKQLGPVLAPAGKEVFVVSLDPAKSRSAEYLKGTFHWHIDDTTNDVPAKATMLTARHVAMVGGGTEFASTYAAYENLPEQDRKRYDGLRVVHTFEASQRLVHPDPTDEQLAAWRTLPSHESALVWQRRDGRRSLVIGATADHIVGMRPEESRELLDELLAWSTQERFSYVHEWEKDDVVIWDNTGMLHRALPYDPSSERTMHRTTIAGDEAWS